jgi:beta-fructofuranosidase
VSYERDTGYYEAQTLTTCTEFSNETLIIDRSNSSAAASTTPGIATTAQHGKLRLFDVLESSGETKIETLDITIIVDNSVVEVWANDRFVLSTWVWYVRACVWFCMNFS